MYDRLGEAYLASGDKERAAVNYKKSLELDPKNQNAINVLRKLQQWAGDCDRPINAESNEKSDKAGQPFTAEE